MKRACFAAGFTLAFAAVALTVWVTEWDRLARVNGHPWWR